ncbi:hypothetical protein V4V36_16525 [Paenibacillus lautus]|uniref:glycosyltransferase family 2 protein n=1 Tax=Paenibacillus lautus TaxID=1401 RepID=UPI002FBE5873|nr:glycosyltransferase family 2 protein [Cytobacillus firmus]
MKRRRAVRATNRASEKREGRTSGEHYRAGYQAGYALGLRLGQEDRDSVFEGTSIIIPVDPHHDEAIQAIQHIEATTPHLYEVLVADAGAATNTRRYILERSGAVRHIKGNSGESLAHVVNKAMSVSLGEYIAILANASPNLDNWLGILTGELERKPVVKIVYAGSKAAGLAAAANAENPALPASGSEYVLSCLLFRRSLPSEIGMWPEANRSVEEHMSHWLERVPAQERLQAEASSLFVSRKL